MKNRMMLTIFLYTLMSINSSCSAMILEKEPSLTITGLLALSEGSNKSLCIKKYYKKDIQDNYKPAARLIDTVNKNSFELDNFHEYDNRFKRLIQDRIHHDQEEVVFQCPPGTCFKFNVLSKAGVALEYCVGRVIDTQDPEELMYLPEWEVYPCGNKIILEDPDNQEVCIYDRKNIEKIQDALLKSKPFAITLKSNTLQERCFKVKGFRNGAWMWWKGWNCDIVPYVVRIGFVEVGKPENIIINLDEDKEREWYYQRSRCCYIASVVVPIVGIVCYCLK